MTIWKFVSRTVQYQSIPTTRRFGIVKLFHRAEEAIEPLLEVLGPEPFDDWNADLAAKKCRGKRSPIKTTLLDQRFVVGVGNIYACEALHNAGISPRPS